MRTRIDLGSSGSIALSDELPISLTYSIADIRNPEKRNASFSKTLNAPGSKETDIIFGHIFEIGIDGTFNPNIKTPATIYTDGVEQLKGFLQLLKIKRLDDNKIMYECVITGNVGNIFTTLADSLLNEIDLSEYNHVYSKVNQKASWTATVGEGYVYPMINYGATNGLTYNVNDFYPAVYLKQYIDKIFDYAGYSYTSNFFNSDFFKRLVIPYNGIKLGLTQAQIDERAFRAVIGSSGSIVLPSNVGQTNEFTTLVPFNSVTLDPSSQFNTVTNRFVCANAGDYSFYVSFNYQLNSAFAFPPTGFAYIIKNSQGTLTVLTSVNISTMFGEINTTLKTAYISSGGALAAGDEIFIGLRIVHSAINTPRVNLSGGYFYNVALNTRILEGNDLVLSNAIPDKIKQKDLFLSVIKAFNLYIETDKDHDNKLYIEPRNDFYSSGVTVDWTDKLDISQDIEISPMGDLTSRRYNFTYTDDKDYYNDIYKKSYNEAYGSRLIDTGNEFITGTNETKIMFSPTPLVDSNSHDRILSYISEVFMGNTANPKAFNIRLLYYGGAKTTNNPWTYTSITGTTSETTYPYAGHLDDPANPTLDLSFGVPLFVYYDALKYTNNNLYNKYYRQFIDEITDKDSKIVSGNFHLTPIDILDLDFRNQFLVDGHFLRLNKIPDHNPLGGSTTKCEFIKIKNANAFVPQVLIYPSGAGIDTPFDL